MPARLYGVILAVLLLHLVCAQYNPWSQWTRCSCSYGNQGKQSRTRSCSGYGCNGPQTVQQSCSCYGGGQNVYVTAAWTAWTNSQCSVTCGQGYVTRKRTCSSPTGAQCSGSSTDQTTCNKQPCPTWGSWTQGSCSTTCGQGYITRTRTCQYGSSCGGGGYTNKQICNMGPCPSWGQWQPWSQCSAECGSGSQDRYRTCSHGNLCAGNAEEVRACNHDPCASWSNWGGWGQCSVTCSTGNSIGQYGGSVSTGSQSRNRDCSGYGQCTGKGSDSRSCQPSPPACASWGDWASWSSCPITCRAKSYSASSPAVQIRDRQCIGAGRCTGPSASNRVCQPVPQQCAEWNTWGAWSSCSLTCVGGSPGYGGGGSLAAAQVRSRQCSGYGDCQGTASESRSCLPAPPQCASWSAWTPWSACSETCTGGGGYQGGSAGQQSRSRQCSGSGNCQGIGSESRPCSPQPPQCASWNAWGAWSSCSVTCIGGGSGYQGDGGSSQTRQTRSRQCSGSGNCQGTGSESRSCNPAPPQCAAWTQWGTWSSCSVSCLGNSYGGGGSAVQNRNRRCQGGSQCSGLASDSRTCYPTPGQCSSWGAWSPWAPCSTTCAGTNGVSYKARTCQGSGCQGRSREERSCGGYGSCTSYVPNSYVAADPSFYENRRKQGR